MQQDTTMPGFILQVFFGGSTDFGKETASSNLGRGLLHLLRLLHAVPLCQDSTEIHSLDDVRSSSDSERSSKKVWG